MKYKKCILCAVLVVVVVWLFYSYDSIHRKGLDTWLVGQTAEDHYPDYGRDAAVLKTDYTVQKKEHLILSNVYVMKCSDNYQVRFRIAYNFPFLHSSFFTDTEWLKLTDSQGNDYFSCLTVYPSTIMGFHCIDVTIPMDADTFSKLSGSKLTVSAVCTEDDSNTENSYASCEVEIQIPAFD